MKIAFSSVELNAEQLLFNFCYILVPEKSKMENQFLTKIQTKITHKYELNIIQLLLKWNILNKTNIIITYY